LKPNHNLVYLTAALFFKFLHIIGIFGALQFIIGIICTFVMGIQSCKFWEPKWA